MDDIQLKLIKMVKERPECLDDRKQLRAHLLDYLPQNKLQQNLILNAYDEEIVQKLNFSLDTTLHALRMTKTLSDGYGLTKDAATWSVVTWCYMLVLTEIADIINSSVVSAGISEHAPQKAREKPLERQKLRGNMMYIAGTECPYGNVRLEAIGDGKIWWELYKLGSNDCSEISSFNSQAYITVPKGMLLKVDHDVFISKV